MKVIYLYQVHKKNQYWKIHCNAIVKCSHCQIAQTHIVTKADPVVFPLHTILSEAAV